MAVPASRNGQLSFLEEAAELSTTGLRFLRDLSFDEWQDYGRRLQYVHGAMLWWIGDWLRYGERQYGEMYAQALDETEYAYQTLADAVWVAGRFDEISRRRENLPFSHHREVSGLDSADADALLDAAEEHGWSRKELRKAVRRFRQGLERGDPGAIPPGDVYLVDPPWAYEIDEVGGSGRSGADHKYPTMEIDQLIDHMKERMPPLGDALMLLWATAPLLPDAFRLMRELGFDYRTSAVWDKERIGMGWWFRGQHEHLLVGRRGEFPPPPEDVRVGSVFREPRGPHSKKPEAVYRWIEQAFPNASWVDCFGREDRDGWQVWGDEVAANGDTPPG